MAKTARPKTRPRKRAPRARDGATEDRILQAAHRVFLRDGTAGARMQEIAREAGVNKALLHYYFRSKDQLAQAVFRQNAGKLFPAVFGVLGADLSLEEKVARVVEVELDHLSRHPYLPAYVISEVHHNPARIQEMIASQTGQGVDAMGAQVLAIIQRQIDEGVRAGHYRPLQARHFLVSLLALCIFPFAARPMLQVFLGMDEEAFARFIEQRRRGLPSFFLAGLRP